MCIPPTCQHEYIHVHNTDEKYKVKKRESRGCLLLPYNLVYPDCDGLLGIKFKSLTAHTLMDLFQVQGPQKSVRQIPMLKGLPGDAYLK